MPQRPLRPWSKLPLRAALAAVAVSSGPAHAVEKDLGPIVLLPPALGLRASSARLEGSATVNWTVQFGGAISEREGHALRPWQTYVAPGVLFSRQGVRYTGAAGARYRWAGWKYFRPGLGLGVDVEIGDTLRSTNVGFTPELVGYFGPCCTPGSISLSLKGRVALRGPLAGIAEVGLSFW